MANEEVQFSDSQWGGRQLRKITLFNDLSDAELTELYESGEIIKVTSGSHVVVEGEPTRGLYILLEGTVSIYKNDASKKNLVRLAYLEAGAVFGELSLFDPSPRSATVAAETPCQLFSLDFDSFESFMNSKGDEMKARFFKRCAEDMSEKFRTQNQDYIISQELLWRYALRSEEEK